MFVIAKNPSRMEVKMNAQVQAWMPAVLSLFGTLIVVVLTAWLNTRALSAQIDSLRNELRAEIQVLRAETTGRIDALRAELKQLMAELELPKQADHRLGATGRASGRGPRNCPSIVHSRS
jgi:sensor domain CHASE-containing protein